MPDWLFSDLDLRSVSLSLDNIAGSIIDATIIEWPCRSVPVIRPTTNLPFCALVFGCKHLSWCVSKILLEIRGVNSTSYCARPPEKKLRFIDTLPEIVGSTCIGQRFMVNIVSFKRLSNKLRGFSSKQFYLGRPFFFLQICFFCLR